ncbi:MAG: valine--tRNA ligase [Cytophagales bacterium]|nr:MAG: valine--tRNA ligase [Cytophagales bacterium]
MSEISKIYDPSNIENKWYSYWLQHNFFHSEPNPNKKPYTIVIPPPNVTGVLHMGHMLNNTIQDVLIRRKRMQGFEACWVPGTDHASIATEAKVVAMLKEKGINKKDLSREEFLKYAWEWKEKYGGIILEQLKKLGASCDWERTRFTMEEPLSEAVIDVFIDLYNKGLIYRGARMVNWDPQGLTAVSDEEVIYKEVNSKLYYIKYYSSPPQGEGLGVGLNGITIATTRPETIMADVAICVNPSDDRYKHLIGTKVIIPLINKEIPVIADEYVDIEFGTGCLKLTPAHDINDYNIGLKHKLEVIDILNPNGILNEKAQIYVGEDRFVARKKIAKELEEKGYLIEAKEMVNKVGTSERTGAVIEPRISTQWFCSMKEMAKPALENVLNGNIKLHPNKFINTYKHWMENVQDWCISRQLWWGQQIPAWYLPNGDFVVAKTKDEAISKIVESKKALTFGEGWEGLLTQDEDVLDTWFSSWLWPISVFSPLAPEGGTAEPASGKGIVNGKISPIGGWGAYYYPTQDLVTAPEILFFWVARMIMAGYEFKGDLPFSNVYLTGIVRDKQGRKMSKSLGNSPDPIELIEKYSADGVRVGMLYASPAGNDLLFDEKYCEQGRNFANKLWNAFRLINGLEILPIPEGRALVIPPSGVGGLWFNHKFNQKLAEIEDNYDKYRISDALKGVYSLVWDDFCAWYLEMIKPEFGKPIDKTTYDQTIAYFEKILKIVHPFMPFITEEIWHEIANRNQKECIIVAEYPVLEPYNQSFIDYSDKILEIISQVRNFRSSKGLSPKVAFKLVAKPIQTDALLDYVSQFETIIKKLVNISEIIISKEALPNANFIVGSLEFHIPLEGKIDAEKDKAETQKEIDYLLGFLKSVDAKLSNEKFVANAKPEILANEQKKKADAEAKLFSLQNR